jgi:hypothetical protein
LAELLADKFGGFGAALKGAELGIWRATTSRHLLDSFPNLKMLFMVDEWRQMYPAESGKPIKGALMSQHAWEQHRVTAMAATEPWKRRRTVLRMDVCRAACHVEDGTLDFFYVDAGHSLPEVYADCMAWWPKLKETGLACGHDASKKGVRGGVKKFVADLELGLTFKRGDGLIWWLE